MPPDLAAGYFLLPGKEKEAAPGISTGVFFSGGAIESWFVDPPPIGVTVFADDLTSTTSLPAGVADFDDT